MRVRQGAYLEVGPWSNRQKLDKPQKLFQRQTLQLVFHSVMKKSFLDFTNDHSCKTFFGIIYANIGVSQVKFYRLYQRKLRQKGFVRSGKDYLLLTTATFLMSLLLLDLRVDELVFFFLRFQKF